MSKNKQINKPMMKPQHARELLLSQLLTVFAGKREACQHPVIDEFLCMVAGCVLGTDVCHWMFLKGQHGWSTRFQSCRKCMDLPNII